MNRTLFLLFCLALLPALAASNARSAGVAAKGSKVTLEAGEYPVAGKTVTLAKEATFTIAPAESVTVTDEAYVLSNDKPDSWFGATHLRACLSAATVLPDCLVAGSLVVKSPDGTVMEKGRDYLVDERWAGLGRVKDGRIPDGSLSLISYRVAWCRIDSVTLDASGRAALVRGTPEVATPEPPPVGKDMLRVANIYMPYNAKDVAEWQVFPVGAPYSEPDAAEMARRGAMIPKTLAKLRAGEPVTIVAWGDSVTVGDDASSADDTYARLFLTRLRQRFPKSTITLVNAGISGSNTGGRLPALKREVLDAHPDLVTIEFVNDMSLPDGTLRANWRKALDDIHAAGAEAITITPHFVMPDMMAKTLPRGDETRAGVPILREVSKEKGVAVADASRRWAHLDDEGIPYITLLANGINHPDNRGHDMYARELLTFFPAGDTP
jgi:lysophospholipase L1-like esterase